MDAKGVSNSNIPWWRHQSTQMSRVDDSTLLVFCYPQYWYLTSISSDVDLSQSSHALASGFRPAGPWKCYGDLSRRQREVGLFVGSSATGVWCVVFGRRSIARGGRSNKNTGVDLEISGDERYSSCDPHFLVYRPQTTRKNHVHVSFVFF